MPLPEVHGVITADELRVSAATIAEWQLPNGMIPWFPGGHADPWNHVEGAMALAVTGHLDEAEAAYQWSEWARQGQFRARAAVRRAATGASGLAASRPAREL